MYVLLAIIQLHILEAFEIALQSSSNRKIDLCSNPYKKESCMYIVVTALYTIIVTRMIKIVINLSCNGG